MARRRWWGRRRRGLGVGRAIGAALGFTVRAVAIGVAAAWLLDGQRGPERRQRILGWLRRVVGQARARVEQRAEAAAQDAGGGAAPAGPPPAGAQQPPRAPDPARRGGGRGGKGGSPAQRARVAGSGDREIDDDPTAERRDDTTPEVRLRGEPTGSGLLGATLGDRAPDAFERERRANARDGEDDGG
jgi:hypothetical protein